MTTQPDPARTAATYAWPKDNNVGSWSYDPDPVKRAVSALIGCSWHSPDEFDSLQELAHALLTRADALAASAARLAEVERENARLARIETEVRSIVADINDGKADSYWLRLARIAMPDLGTPSWNDLHPAPRSAGEAGPA